MMAGPDEMLAVLDRAIARLGQDDWAETFVDLVGRTGAAQVMVFSYAPEFAGCLLSWNFRAKALGARLAEDYLSGWFRDDPLFGAALALRPGELRRFQSQDIADDMSAEYRHRFYDKPGLSGKTAVLVAGAKLRLAVNLYWARSEASGNSSQHVETILARLALLHFEAKPANDYPAPLAALSYREREVCLGILSGKKAEAIAADLGVAVSSVVTYRARAYQKLGISSRGALFAVCGK